MVFRRSNPVLQYDIVHVVCIWALDIKNQGYWGFRKFEFAAGNEALEPKKHFWKKSFFFFHFQNIFFFDLKKFSIFCHFLDLKIQLILCKTLIKCIYHPQNSPKIKKKLVDWYGVLRPLDGYIMVWYVILWLFGVV